MFKRHLTRGYYVPSHVLSLYQEGGELKYDENAQQKDPMMMLIEAAPKVLESNDCETMKQFIATFIEVTSGGNQASTKEEMKEGSAKKEEEMLQEGNQQKEAQQVPMAKKGMRVYSYDDDDMIY